MLIGAQSGHTAGRWGGGRVFPREAVGMVDLKEELPLESLQPGGPEEPPVWERGRPKVLLPALPQSL